MSQLIVCAKCSKSLAQVTRHIVTEGELRTLNDYGCAVE